MRNISIYAVARRDTSQLPERRARPMTTPSTLAQTIETPASNSVFSNATINARAIVASALNGISVCPISNPALFHRKSILRIDPQAREIFLCRHRDQVHHCPDNEQQCRLVEQLARFIMLTAGPYSLLPVT